MYIQIVSLCNLESESLPRTYVCTLMFGCLFVSFMQSRGSRAVFQFYPENPQQVFAGNILKSYNILTFL